MAECDNDDACVRFDTIRGATFDNSASKLLV